MEKNKIEVGDVVYHNLHKQLMIIKDVCKDEALCSYGIIEFIDGITGIAAYFDLKTLTLISKSDFI